MEVRLLSPAKLEASFKASHVIAPGSMGYLDMGPHHAMFATELKAGVLSIETEEKKIHYYFVSGGILECALDKINILSEFIEDPAKIDRARAEKAQKKAEALLEQSRSDGTVDIPAVLLSLDRAKARLQTLEKSKKIS